MTISAEQPSFNEAQFLDRYCVSCHGPEKQKGDRRFDRLDVSSHDRNTLFDLQDIIDQLVLEDMPPEKSRQPSAKERQILIEQLTERVKSAREAQQSTNGTTVLRRLNRREYIHTVSDLLGLDLSMSDPTSKFPRDNTVDHLDNIGDALVTSGYLLDQYLEAADMVIEKALSVDRQKEQVWIFNKDFRQQPELNIAHREAFNFKFMCLYDSPLAEQPEGAYGSLPGFSEGVPADGLYEIKVKAQALHRNTPYDPSILKIDLTQPFRLGVVPGDRAVGQLHVKQPNQPLLAEVEMEDNKVKWYTFQVHLDRGKTPRFVFTNGMAGMRSNHGRLFRAHQKSLPKMPGYKDGIVKHRNLLLGHGRMPQIRIHEVQVRGPIVTAWPPASYQLILGERAFSRSRARKALQQFMTRAFRRPVQTDEVNQFMAVAKTRVSQGHSQFQGFKDALKAVLCSPSFLYLQTSTDDRLSSHALATRLSYFLWASMPDEQLATLADNGNILDPEILRSQVRRMLLDTKSERFVSGFVDSWLNLRALGDMPPDREKYGSLYYARSLEDDMKMETQLFVKYVIDENRSAAELIDADYSFINHDLATLYGIPSQVPVEGGYRFRRVEMKGDQRGGLLGQASVLTVTANGIETSPVTRGVWLLENILGTPPAPPPDNVPEIDPDVRGAKSIRDLLHKHRTIASCNECHRKIDPLGFALEAFGPIGEVRQHYENGAQIDDTGRLPNGKKFKGVAGLKRVLVSRQAFFARTLTEKLMAYAIGRRIEPSDRIEIDAILSTLKADGYPVRSLIEEIVVSDLFRQP